MERELRIEGWGAAVAEELRVVGWKPVVLMLSEALFIACIILLPVLFLNGA